MTWIQSDISPRFLKMSEILGHRFQGQDLESIAWKASGVLVALLLSQAICVGFYRCMYSQDELPPTRQAFSKANSEDFAVYLSPLAGIPGPKLAGKIGFPWHYCLAQTYNISLGLALTHWYEGYYEVWLGGKYFLRLEEIHKQYGMPMNPILLV